MKRNAYDEMRIAGIIDAPVERNKVPKLLYPIERTMNELEWIPGIQNLPPASQQARTFPFPLMLGCF
jgi:hypothetical protein